jgi:hypothetical protein
VNSVLLVLSAVRGIETQSPVEDALKSRGGRGSLRKLHNFVMRTPGSRGLALRELKDGAGAQPMRGAFGASAWNRLHGAQQLGICCQTPLYKIQEHRLSPISA